MSWQAETPQEKIGRLRSELEAVQKSTTLAEAELAEMEASMRDFEMQFDQFVGYLLEELALIEAEVAAYKTRIRQLRMDKTIEKGYQSVEDQYEEKWHKPRQRTPKIKIKQFAETAPITQARLKKLYRQLARQYHPDLAQNEEDRVLRTQKMAAINEAYNAGSLVELQAIAAELMPQSVIQTPTASSQTGQPQPRTEAERIRALRDEITTTERKLRQLEDAIRNFHHRPLVEFALEAKLAKRHGRDLLTEMADELQRKIARRQAERDMIRSQFDSLYY